MTSYLLCGSERADEKVHKTSVTVFSLGVLVQEVVETQLLPQFCHFSNTVDKTAQSAGLCPWAGNQGGTESLTT